jgi:hypothetical protein
VSAIQIIRSGLLTLGALAFTQAFLLDVTAQTVYKSVDEQGNITFTDRPPLNLEDVELEAVAGLDISRTDTGGIARQNEESGKQAVADNAAEQMRANDDAEDAGIVAAEKEQRVAKCKNANERMTEYTKARRLYRTTGDGEREYLSDAELDAERSEAVRAVNEWCD